MRLYLCGRMRGMPGLNFHNFNFAATVLRSLGYVVFNPAEYDVNYRGIDPNKITDENAPTLASCMVVDLAEVCSSDLVACLDGWEQSQGGKLEVAVAQYLGIPTVTVSFLLKMKRIPSVDELLDNNVAVVNLIGRTATVEKDDDT